MSDVKELLRAIPRRDSQLSGKPRFLYVWRGDMNITVHAAAGERGIKTCEKVVVTIQSKDSMPRSFICPRSEVLQ